MNEKNIFTAIAVAILGTLLAMVWRKNTKTASVLFVSCLALLIAFYLFVFSNLAQFTLDMVSGKVQLLKQSAEKAGEELTKIEALQKESAEKTKQIDGLLADSARMKEDLKRVIKQASPRIITNEQINAFKRSLEKIQKVNIDVVTVSYDKETAYFAHAITDMLNAAGFKTNMRTGQMSGDFGHVPLIIQCNGEDKNIPPEIEELRKAFNEIGIESRIECMGNGYLSAVGARIMVLDKDYDAN